MGTKIKVEIIEEGGIKHGADHFEKGEILSADSDEKPGKYAFLCAAVNHGWAKNVDTGESGERKPGAVKLDVDSIVQKVS